MRLRLLVFICLLTGMLMPAYSAADKDSLNVPFKERIGFHTNTVDWLLLTPNLGVEYSFIQNKYEKVSALLFGKYNPNSSMNINPALVYNIGGARGEVRWYFRTRHISDGEAKLDSLDRAKHGRFGVFWRKLTTRPYSFLAKKNPRLHRAYYIGPYLNFDKYTIKLSAIGYQGYSLGLGATAGYSIPLYQYKNGSSVDFELGFSLGMAMSWNDKFGYDSDADCYYYAGSNSFHVVPSPIVSDLHVAFVYRLKSIREQIVDVRMDKLEELSAIYELRSSYDEKIANFKYPSHIEKTKDGRDSIVVHTEYLPSDSIAAWNVVVNEKNERIREINRRALESGVELDSAMLLDELRLCYEYVELPEKMFAQYDRLLPNKEIKSVSELNDEYLDGLLENYSVVNADNGEFDKQLVNSYGTLRGRLLEKNDSTSEIRLLDLMVHAISNINGSSIKAFNDKYHCSIAGKEVEYDAMPVKMLAPLQIDEERKATYPVDFVFGVDTLALSSSQKFSFKGMNTEIEAKNVYKLVLLEDLLDTTLTPENKSAAKAVKEKKSKKKSKDKKNKAPKKEKADDTVAVETVKKDVDSDDMVAGAVQAIEAIEKNDEESVVEDKVE